MEIYWRKHEKEVEQIFEEFGEQTDNSKYAAGHYKPQSIKIEECI